jgi:hypothetical protein
MSYNLKNYICIDSLCYVVNPENAIKTLGGIERIEKSFQSRNGNLFLNYNPENIFKPMNQQNYQMTTKHQTTKRIDITIFNAWAFNKSN